MTYLKRRFSRRSRKFSSKKKQVVPKKSILKKTSNKYQPKGYTKREIRVEIGNKLKKMDKKELLDILDGVKSSKNSSFKRSRKFSSKKKQVIPKKSILKKTSKKYQPKGYTKREIQVELGNKLKKMDKKELLDILDGVKRRSKNSKRSRPNPWK